MADMAKRVRVLAALGCCHRALMSAQEVADDVGWWDLGAELLELRLQVSQLTFDASELCPHFTHSPAPREEREDLPF